MYTSLLVFEQNFYHKKIEANKPEFKVLLIVNTFEYVLCV